MVPSVFLVIFLYKLKNYVKYTGLSREFVTNSTLDGDEVLNDLYT